MKIDLEGLLSRGESDFQQVVDEKISTDDEGEVEIKNLNGNTYVPDIVMCGIVEVIYISQFYYFIQEIINHIIFLGYFNFYDWVERFKFETEYENWVFY